MDSLKNDRHAQDFPVSHRAPERSFWLRLLCWLEAAWGDFSSLTMPGDCVACGRDDASLCRSCAKIMRQQTAQPYRAEHSADALVGVSGESHLHVVAAGEYRDELAATILAFKNHGRTELAGPLSRVLAKTLESILLTESEPRMTLIGDSPMPDEPILATAAGQILLVPIPSTGAGWRRRGYDPVRLLLRTATREGRLPHSMRVTALLGIRARPPWKRHHQKGLGRSARRSNVRNTMKMRRAPQRRIRLVANPQEQLIVLLDDVLTTGSTLQEAAKTLQRSGFRVAGAVVLAAARAPEGSLENATAERLAKNTFE